jgi:hypothetical protein
MPSSGIHPRPWEFLVLGPSSSAVSSPIGIPCYYHSCVLTSESVNLYVVHIHNLQEYTEAQI